MDQDIESIQFKRKNRNALVLMGILSFCFGMLITKELALPPILLYGVAAILGTYLLVQGMNHPEFITYFLVVYLPYSKVLVGDFGGIVQAFNLTNILMLFIIIVWFSGRYSEDEPIWLKTPLNLPIGLFVFLGFIAVVRGTSYGGGYLHYAIIEFKRWITPIMMYYLVLNTVKKRFMIKNIVIIMIMTTTIVGLMAIYDYINLGDVGSMEKARIGGISDQSNTLAAFFVYYMFLPLGFFLMNMQKKKAWWLLLPFLIMFRGIMVTFSRGGYVACAVGLYAITFVRSRGLFALLIVASIFAVFNPWILPGGIRDRMAQTLEHKSSSASSGSLMGEEGEPHLEASAQSRLDIWKAALQLIKENPIFGVGYGLFPIRIREIWKGGIEIDAHNTYVILATEQGIPCVIIFLIIVFMSIGYSWHLFLATQEPFTKAFSLGVIGGLFGLLAANMFGSRLNHEEVASYFWIILALVMRLTILEKKEPYQPGGITEEKPRRIRGAKLDSVWFDDEPEAQTGEEAPPTEGPEPV
ncbi:MAG TPA: O-antigen ligase family protein [Verrucomicrobiae bacterium]|nr:O-antigen ligase family protein [Verrucomicrobiae bacterium]